MDARNRDFLGRGWRFPVRVDPASGRVMTSQYEDDIAEAVRIILTTRPGERAMRPDFGCAIGDYAFWTLDYTTRHMMRECVEKALREWEARIADVAVEVDADAAEDGKLLIHVSYTVRATNNAFNLVYPYYLDEGAGA